jgi:hypothetical protein
MRTRSNPVCTSITYLDTARGLDRTAGARPPRALPILFALASLALFIGAFAVWVNRQALDTDNWQATSSELLADEQIQAALSPYLVDQLFANADVPGAIQQRLPSNLQVLAGPASAGLRQLADRAAPELLARPKVQGAWVTANAAGRLQRRALTIAEARAQAAAAHASRCSLESARAAGDASSEGGGRELLRRLPAQVLDAQDGQHRERDNHQHLAKVVDRGREGQPE